MHNFKIIGLLGMALAANIVMYVSYAYLVLLSRWSDPHDPWMISLFFGSSRRPLKLLRVELR